MTFFQEKSFLIISLYLLTLTPAHTQSLCEGYIITNDYDTLSSVFVKAKRRRIDKRNNYNMVSVLHKGKVVTYTPENILGYLKEDMFYKAFRTQGSDTELFAKQITSGKADLYCTGISVGKYYFKKKNENHFNVMDANIEVKAETIEDLMAPPRPMDISHYNQMVNPRIPNIKSNEEAFKLFFIQYFSDCEALVNKLKHGFYTFNNIEFMFKDYNNQ